MRTLISITALLVAVTAALPVPAADLTKIDRTIAKEPAYQTKAPKYCLLVFGPEAKVRLWLVLDGKVLYVDRNGDGDLTDASERVPPNPNGRFEVGPISLADGKVLYSNLSVWVWKNDRVQLLVTRKTDLEHRKKIKWGESLWQFAGPSDISGRSWTLDKNVNVEEHDFQFANRPQDAPIVHFDGPLTLKLMDTKLVFVRDQAVPLHVMVGAKGVGKGTFTQLLFLPGDPGGAAEIVFPHRDPDGKPIVVKVGLNAPG